jgi:hypothetical protein
MGLHRLGGMLGLMSARLASQFMEGTSGILVPLQSLPGMCQLTYPRGARPKNLCTHSLVCVGDILHLLSIPSFLPFWVAGSQVGIPRQCIMGRRVF